MGKRLRTLFPRYQGLVSWHVLRPGAPHSSWRLLVEPLSDTRPPQLKLPRGLGALHPSSSSSLTNVRHYFIFFLIEQERARLLRGQSVQQVGPQGLLYVQQRELAVTSPKDGRLGSSELGVLPKGCWILYFISFLNRLRLHSGF